jgi:outer membrane protein OmpA-like peptidoglycan-associated protein/tetratricopeptide (TPR) repeat protein
MKSYLRKSIIIFLLLFCLSSLFSQVNFNKAFIKAVKDADISFYYDEDYEKAATLYESILSHYPDNCNLTAKLGICYLNVDGKKAEALKLLTKASHKVVTKDNEYVEYGEKAPLDTYLYLAIAYHQNDSLSKAIELYNNAKKKLEGTKLFRKEYIDKQITDCRYAIEMEKKPQPVVYDLFISWLTDYPGASNPVLSKNDSVFVFTIKRDGKTHILCSIKTDTWNTPVDITAQLGGNNLLYSNSITGDGKLLIIYMEEGGDGNIYYSQRKGTTWTKIKSVGKTINTIYWESHAFITPDGRTLYFASNRPEGRGELDIWVSEKDADGNWKTPVNCGNVINTPYNENTPYYDPSSKTLIFSSVGHPSMGGYDVFQSVNKNGKWTTPIGLSFGLNNTTENTFFIQNNTSTGFITSLYNEKTLSRNIYSIITNPPPDKPIITHGIISLQDGLPVDPEQSHIQLSDQKTGITKVIPLNDTSSFKFEINPGDLRLLISRIGFKTDTISIRVKTDTLVKYKSLIDTGIFTFEVKPGDYQLLVGHKGYKTDTINLILPQNLSGGYVSVTASLIPDKVVSGNFLSIKNILFEYNSHKLNDKSVTTLEILKSILINYPELKIEVAGYTDAIGSSEYNKKLADYRAQAVIDRLSGSGIARSRFVKKAFGASDFAAVNTNPDGTDNPEGRKYNRRATIGIVDPHTGVAIVQETYTPEHLRSPNSLKFSIVLLKTKNSLPPEYFSSLELTGIQFIRSVMIDSVSVNYLGMFYSRNDALIYLEYAKSKGFKDAYVINQYQIASSQNLTNSEVTTPAQAVNKATYTIQLRASLKPLDMKLFKNIPGVREVASDDGYYRYIYGEYNSFTKAKTELVTVQESGFKSAFIREADSLNKK